MQRIKKVIGLVSLLFVFTMTSFAQLNKEHFRVFDGQGNPANLETVISKMKESDVVFLGESHDDSVGHLIQFELFKKAFENYGKKRKVVLSLEMFERDVQIVLDEYLQNLIAEKQFLASSRPWGNYQTDYRPLVEFAKENKLKVIAANAPRRYVNMVSRMGRDSVNKLSKKAKKWLAPLPFGNSSKAYSEKFNSQMAGHGSENILHSQTLWDATMAYSVFKQIKKNKKSLVLHLNGSFHTASRLGTVEHLLKFRPKTRIIVVTMLYEKDFQTFNREKHTGLGDFVIITDAQQPRSKMVRQ
jgi:uncharacterized iron-regulated protein